MTVPAALRARDGLARPGAPHGLEAAEPLPEGLKRATSGALERAVSGFVDGRTDLGVAVERCVYSLRHVASLLALVRSGLADRVFRFEIEAVEEPIGLLEGVRRARRLEDATAGIIELYGDLLASGMFEEVRGSLALRAALAEAQLVEDPHTLERVVRSLERAHQRYSSWPARPETRDAYGIGISDSFDSVAPGLESAYRTGRQEMAEAYRAGSSLTDWHESVSRLSTQIGFLASLWPEVLEATVSTLARLERVLGEEESLADLAASLEARPDLSPRERERSLLQALIAQRRSELRLAAEIMGRRVYAEKPGALVNRFSEYWEVRSLVARSPSTLAAL